MKRFFYIILLYMLFVPGISVHAEDYILKNNTKMSGTYAGAGEQDYHYYMVQSNKSGYLSITATTSDKQNLNIDICNANKEVVASDISIENKKSIVHTCKKGEIYYIRIKGTEGVTYDISYKIVTFNKLKYAKKYHYTFTNASLSESNMLEIPIKTSNSGILHVMCETDHPLKVRYYLGKRKAISSYKEITKRNLTGIGVLAKKQYYVKFYNPDNTISGTTKIQNLKYQIDSITTAKNTSKVRAKALNKNQYVRTLIPAGKKTTVWYKIKIANKQKLTITLDSQMMQNNGKNLQLYICNSSGKKLNSSPIIINGEASCSYKKKYIMKYPKTVFGTTAAFPEGTYYIKIESKTKTSSGAFQIKWN